MKTLYILFLQFVVLSNLYSEVDPKWYYDDEYTFGKVKSVDCMEYKVKQNFDELLIDKCILRVQFEFNRYGEETKFIISDCENNYFDYVEHLYKYDKNDNITYKEQQIKVYDRKYRFDKPTKYIKHFEYIYNSNNKIILKRTFNDKKELEITNKYVYDENLKLIEKVDYDYILNKIINTSYEYNNNNLISENTNITINAGIKKLKDNEFELEKKWNLYLSNGKDSIAKEQILSTRKVYSYDIFGNLKVKNEFNYDLEGNDLSIYYSYQYNSKGEVIEKKIFNNYGELSEILKYENNILKENEKYYNYNEKPNSYNFKYTKFDNKMNWIEKIVYYNNKPVSIIKRKIEYYE